MVGLTILFLFIIIAFIGYVLVWAQIRFWASVVITSLLTVIPYWGFNLVFWIWRGFSVTGSTLKFFFVLHFLLPWVSLIFIMFHLLLLHNRGSTSRLFVFLNFDKVTFFPYYIFKDLINILLIILIFFFSINYSFLLGDSEIFLESNLLVRPVHIVPEWYFLFAYAILRCIPRKIVGVIFLVLRIFIFYIFLIFRRYLLPLDIFNNIVLFFFFLGVCY